MNVSLSNTGRATLAAVLLLTAACGGSPDPEPPAAGEAEPLVVYSGRNESLIGPLLERFIASSGIEVEVRYGETSEMTATLLEEGERTPADVFLSQDAAALGALAQAGLLQPIGAEIASQVPAAFRDAGNRWIGLSGRARAVVYNTESMTTDELPQRLEEIVDERFSGRYGVPPTNGSFQAHMAVYHAVEGAEALDALLAGMVANDAQRYPKNSAIVQAVADGEVEFGLVNHYYVARALAEDPEAPLGIFYMPEGAASNYVNLAGGAVLSDRAEAQQLLGFLVSEEAQTYFGNETMEYPIAAGVAPSVGLVPIDTVPTPDVDFATAAGLLEPTLAVLTASGLVE